MNNQDKGRLRWFGHVERKSGDDWVSACRNVVVAGVRCVGNCNCYCLPNIENESDANQRVEGGRLCMNV